MNVNNYIILKPKEKTDSKWQPITDVIVINKFTRKNNTTLTKYNLTFYHANLKSIFPKYFVSFILMST